MYDENSNASSAAVSSVQTAQLSAATASQQPSNAMVSQLLNVKDSRWLQVEVCREFQRGQCARSDQECKFAHPPPHVDVQQGRVTACYDSIKGRCTRENPKCKYLHPPQHIKDQLLINGRNNLALKNLLCSQLTQSAAGQPIATAATMNPLAQLMVQQQQQQQSISAGMMQTLPYPFYQGLVYSPVLGDPYQQAQLQQQQQQQQQQQNGLLQGQNPLAGLQVLSGLGQLSQLTQLSQLGQYGQTLAQPQTSAAAGLLPAASLPLLGSRKRPLDEEVDHVPAQPNTIYNLAAAAQAASVPSKRPSMEKTANGTVMFNPPTLQGQQQFNPYLQQSLLQGYVPVSFAGQTGALPSVHYSLH